MRQPFVLFEIIRVDDLAQRRRIPKLACQIAVSDDAAHRIFGRQHARGANIVGNAPRIEMLHRTLRQILPFGDTLRLNAPLDQGTRDTAQSEFDGERGADRSTTDDGDLIVLIHARDFHFGDL